MKPPSIGQLGERALLERLSRYVREGERIVRAYSEDCAVVDFGSDTTFQLITMDVLVDGQHFRSEWMPPYYLGRKAVNVNISDVSAMGGRARFFLVSLGLPSETPVSFVDEIYRGIDSAAQTSGVILAGGNVAASSVLFIDITMIGEVQKNRVVLRKGAGAGDAIYVSGALGEAACGLKLLEEGMRLDSVTQEWMRGAILAQLDPPVLQDAAARLASSGCVTSMIDLSDGLASDLPHLCRESRAGAVILAEKVPVAEGLRKTAGFEPLHVALAGGEDYHLLYTVSRERRDEFLRTLGDSAGFEIGAIVPEKEGICIQFPTGQRAPLAPGFQHFLNRT